MRSYGVEIGRESSERVEGGGVKVPVGGQLIEYEIDKDPGTLMADCFVRT